jgi:glycerol uptake facilitator-like aquaporin
MFTKQHIAALTGEFIGTAVLVLTVLALVNSQIPFVFFIAIAAGLALGMMVLTLGRISGLHFNPAVSIGLWTVREISTLRMLFYIIAQLFGALAALSLFNYLLGRDSWTLQTPTFDAQVLVAEVVGTAVFTLGIAAAVAQKFTGGAKAAVIGGSLTVGIFIASVASPAFLNPAVALANQTINWAFILGPILGSVIGFNLYTLMISAATSPVTVQQPRKQTVAAKTTSPASRESTPKKK